MCRGFQEIQRERLRIRAFTVRLSSSSSSSSDALTLHYLPRINGTSIEVEGFSVAAECPAFVTLHRVVSSASAVYASRERVVVCEGARFQIYAEGVRVLRGMFRRVGGESTYTWKVECRMDDDEDVFTAAEVTVAAEGDAAVMREYCERRRRSRRKYCCEMEEIPEEREEGQEEESGVCGCCECGGGDDGVAEHVAEASAGWAVDVGIWVVCIGVGYLVTKASSTRFTSRKSILSFL